MIEWSQREPRIRRLLNRWKTCENKDEKDVLFSRIIKIVDELRLEDIANARTRIPPSTARRNTILTALWKAMIQFDDTKGGSFIGYALTKMKYDLRKMKTQHLNDLSVVKIPRARAEQYNAILASVISWQEVNGSDRYPSSDEIHVKEEDMERFFQLQSMIDASSRFELVGDDIDENDLFSISSFEDDVNAALDCGFSSLGDAEIATHGGKTFILIDYDDGRIDINKKICEINKAYKKQKNKKAQK